MPRLKNGRQQGRKKKQKSKKKLVVAMVPKTLRSHAAKQSQEKEHEPEDLAEIDAANQRPKRGKPSKRLIEEEAQKGQLQKKQPVKKSPSKKGKKKKGKVTKKSKAVKRKANVVEDAASKRPRFEEVQEMLTEFDGIQSYEELQECEAIETVAVATNARQRLSGKLKPVKQKRARYEKSSAGHAAQIIIESVHASTARHESEDDEEAPEEDDDDIDDSLFFGIPTEKSPEIGSCSHCKKKFHRIELADHVNTCPERYVQCRECNKVLSNLQTLERHHKRFHLKLREVPCTLCDKMFIDEAAARKHLKTVHFKVKNFHCPHCDKSFSQRNKLTYHVRTHSGEKPFACTECGRSFSLLWNLKTHLRTHTGEKPYACDVCGRKFTQKQNMTSHMTTHKKPKVARSNTYVSFTNSDSLDYFSMNELRQSGKATMVQTNQSALKLSSQARSVGQGSQYLINQLGKLSSAVAPEAESNASMITISQNNDLENGLGLLSSVARKGDNTHDASGSIEVECIVDEAHLSNQVAHADQVVEVLVQPQGGDGNPPITLTTSTIESQGVESFVSTSNVGTNTTNASRDVSNMVSASVATLQQQHQAAGAQNVIPIGNANLSGLANILQNPEVLSAINAAAASNKFIVIGPVGMLSGQNASSTNTVSIATAYSNDNMQGQPSLNNGAIANFASDNMVADRQQPAQTNQPLMEITAVDHLDSSLAAACDVEMIPADTSQDVAIQFADATSNEESNEVQSTVSSVMNLIMQESPAVITSSNLVPNSTSSVHSYAIVSETNAPNSDVVVGESSDVVSSQDGAVQVDLEASSNAEAEQVSSSAENNASQLSDNTQADSSKDKEEVQSSSVVDASNAQVVFDINIASSYMTDEKLVTQSTDNTAGNITEDPHIMEPYPATASGEVVSAQTDGNFVADDSNASQSYIVTLGDQFVSSSTRTVSLANSSFITSSGLSGTGQSMVMVTADGQSYFTTLTLPEGFQQNGNQQIILADSMANTFNIPVVDGSLSLDSLGNLQSAESTAFTAQFQNNSNEANVETGIDIRVEQVDNIEDSTVTDSSSRVVANSNSISAEQPNSSIITASDFDASVTGSNQTQQHVGNSLDDQVDSNVSNIDSDNAYTSQSDAAVGYATASSANDFNGYQQALIDATELVTASSTANYEGVVSGTENIATNSLGTDQLEAQRTGVTSSNSDNVDVLNAQSSLPPVEQEESFVSTSLQ